jgi:hypothetical protein
MLDPETFLTELYVLADTFCKTHLAPVLRPGPAPSLSPSEVMTLGLFSQWAQFPSEAAFYRYARRRLRPLFPTLPSRPQFNRLLRGAQAALVAFALWLGQELAQGDDRAFEALDGTGLATRNAKRRGAGWLAGEADIGRCTRLGWYEGVRLLLAVTPTGAITGWGIGPASTNDRVLAETFFAARARPQPGLPGVGAPTSDRYVADMGFTGQACEARWAADYGAVVVCPPQSDSHRAWPKALRTWLAGIRQVIETVNDRLLTAFGLERERPHDLSGLHARLAATIGLHNVCCWLNRKLGRGLLQVADLIDW